MVSRHTPGGVNSYIQIMFAILQQRCTKKIEDWNYLSCRMQMYSFSMTSHWEPFLFPDMTSTSRSASSLLPSDVLSSSLFSSDCDSSSEVTTQASRRESQISWDLMSESRCLLFNLKLLIYDINFKCCFHWEFVCLFVIVFSVLIGLFVCGHDYCLLVWPCEVEAVRPKGWIKQYFDQDDRWQASVCGGRASTSRE